MSEYLRFGLTLLASAGVSAALCGALAWLARAWLSERLKASIRHEYDQQMAALNASLKAQGDTAAATLKGEIEREADKLRLAALSFGEVQKAAISKRLESVDETWRAILELQDATPSAMSYLDILLTSEYSNASKDDGFRGNLAELDHFPIVGSAMERSRKLVQHRPYIGEYLWALYSTYQAVFLRTIYLIDRSKMEPKLLLWFDDRLIRQHIQSALGKDALREFDDTSIAKVSWVRDRFTHVILQSMERIVAGKEFGEAALQQAERMESHLREAQRDARRA